MSDVIWKVLVHRDGYTKKEAINIVKDVKAEWDSYEESRSYDDLEELISFEFGLEPDYVMDFLVNEKYV